MPHCLPGLDDGPQTMTEALALCRALVADGIETAIATPHQLGLYDNGSTHAETIRESVGHLVEALAEQEIPLRVLPGADVRIDERLPALIEDNQVLTLAGSRYLLLELPHDVFIDPTRTVVELADRGIRTIISHPERHKHIARQPAIAEPWLARGALLQLTAGSLIGREGATAEEASWYWLANGEAAFVATDAHNVSSRRPYMTAAATAIVQRFGYTVAQRVCRENPSCVLEDREITTGETTARETTNP